MDSEGFNRILCIFTIKLISYFFIDDQAVFAKSPLKLQQILNDIINYCDTRGLQINTDKMKATIFAKGRQTYYGFYKKDEAIELIYSFKHLGITLFKNGNWHRSQKCIAQHETHALHRLFSFCEHRNAYIRKL